MNETPITNKKILIIGGTGSLGQTLVRRLLPSNHLYVMSRDETKQWEMQNIFHGLPIHYALCDIRNKDTLRAHILAIAPEVIINASAMKQVPTCEMFPNESISTNITGIQNLMEVCTQDFQPEVVLGVSTDKACKPINVYGMCKAVGERLVTSANSPSTTTRFINVRYGNVLESRGSIIPLFKYKARTDKQYTLTDPQMTRFLITLNESVDLILTAIAAGRKGDTFVPRLRSSYISDLADVFVDRFGGEKVVIGVRPGEKIHEELVSEEEFTRAFEFNDKYLIIKPLLSKNVEHYNLTYHDSKTIGPAKTQRLSSDMFTLPKDDLKTFLEERGVFDDAMRSDVRDEAKF